MTERLVKVSRWSDPLAQALSGAAFGFSLATFVVVFFVILPGLIGLQHHPCQQPNPTPAATASAVPSPPPAGKG